MNEPIPNETTETAIMTDTARTPRVTIIAERLTAIRKAKGITQVEMAKKLKVTQSMYSKYERGDVRIYSDLLYKMATILDVTPNELFAITKSGNDASEPIENQIPKRFVRRLRGIDSMTRTEQDSLLTAIDTWLAASKVRRTANSEKVSA